MDAEKLWEIFKRGGIRVALISVFSALTFGLVDHFYSQIIPTVAEKIQRRFSPSEFVLTFTNPVAVDEKQTKISAIPEHSGRSVSLQKDDQNRWLVFVGDPGPYWLELHRDDKRIFSVGQINFQKGVVNEKLDTSEGKWAQPSAIAKDDAGTQQPEKSGSQILKGTRWSLSEADFAQIAKAQDNIGRQILFAALNEVGVFEFGSDSDKARIYAYWNVTPELLRQNQVTLEKLGAWGGAFLTWAVSKAGLQPPALSTAYRSWLDWREAVSKDAIKPGMVALFRTNDLRELRAGYLAGVVLRTRPDCTEIISGNVVDRVVVTCVLVPVATTRR
jgi:hypothetical protein